MVSESPIHKGMDAILDWMIDWVMLPLAITVLGACALGAVYGAYLLVAPDEPKDVRVSISPAYWSCTEAYINNIPWRRGILTRFGRLNDREAYNECRCKQWSAHMVGQAHLPDAVCDKGWKPVELSGVR